MHAIFGERFLDNRRPAWHGLGQVVTEPLTAAEALERIGTYQVATEPILTASGMQLPLQAIIRQATPDDPQPMYFGTVSTEYTLITPQQFADLFDLSVGQPVETIGAIRDGRVMFITTKLPTIDVSGDEVEMYLVARNGMDGGHVAGCDLSPVRVVCQNTLALSAEMATETFRVVHDKQAMNRLGAWMQQAYQSAVAKAEAVREAFDLLSAKPVTKKDVTKVVEAAYVMPKAPAHNAPAEVMQIRIGRWEQERDVVLGRRQAAVELFNGDGVGMDTPAAKGTAWGLYNAVCETEDYRRGRGQETDEQRLIGYRHDVKARAFAETLAIAKK